MTTTMTELCELARAAGAAGKEYLRWIDEVQILLEAVDHLDPDAIARAFDEGARSTWRTVWTTASQAYDYAYAHTVESVPWRGKTLRKVLIDPAGYDFQTARYRSGMCGVWTEDPRETDARIQAELDRSRAELAASEKRRQDGLAWLRTAPAEMLESTDANWEAWHARGLESTDARAERDRRAAIAETERRRVLWAESAALVPEGATLIDAGSEARRDEYGTIPGRPAMIWHGVKVIAGWPADDPWKAAVRGADGGLVGALPEVAGWIREGRVRVAGPEQHVPPRPVCERLGTYDLGAIRRVEVGGRVVWVGRAAHGERMVLDERGHLVRAAKVKAAALAAAGW